MRIRCKKITILGPFFGLFLIDFWLFLLRILTVFARACAPILFYFWPCFFAYYAHTDFVFRNASAYAHQSAWIRIFMAIPNLHLMFKTISFLREFPLSCDMCLVLVETCLHNSRPNGFVAAVGCLWTFQTLSHSPQCVQLFIICEKSKYSHI